MRQAFTAIAFALLLTSGFTARAQEITLSDGKYATLGAYLWGTWKYEKQEPRQTQIMRFDRDGSYYYNADNLALEHWGTFSTHGTQLRFKLVRACENKGAYCVDNTNSRMQYAYNLTPSSADVFTANNERWERMK